MKIMMDILGESTQGPLNLVKRIGLVVKNDHLAIQKADELEIWLKSRDIDVFRKEMFSPTARCFRTPDSLMHRMTCSVFWFWEVTEHS